MKLEDLAVKHSYYCSSNNYFSNDCTYEFNTVDDFLSEMGESDMDYNLIFRFDITKYDPEDYYEDEIPKEGYYAEIFNMQQRKGKFCCLRILSVKEEDVDKLVDYLKPRFEHLKELWKPFE